MYCGPMKKQTPFPCMLSTSSGWYELPATSYPATDLEDSVAGAFTIAVLLLTHRSHDLQILAKHDYYQYCTYCTVLPTIAKYHQHSR